MFPHCRRGSEEYSKQPCGEEWTVQWGGEQSETGLKQNLPH